jgi:hypothetical protein
MEKRSMRSTSPNGFGGYNSPRFDTSRYDLRGSPYLENEKSMMNLSTYERAYVGISK